MLEAILGVIWVEDWDTINHGGSAGGRPPDDLWGAAEGRPPPIIYPNHASDGPKTAPLTAPQTAPQTAAQTAPRQTQDSPLRHHLLKPHYSSYEVGPLGSPGDTLRHPQGTPFLGTPQVTPNGHPKGHHRRQYRCLCGGNCFTGNLGEHTKMIWNHK